MTQQLEIPRLRDLRYKLPLMGIESARGCLDLTEDQIEEIAARGALWAFDISTAFESSTPARTKQRKREARPFLRLLTDSVIHLGRDGARQLADDLDAFCQPHPPALEDAITLILPRHDKPFFTGPEIKRCLNCKRSHFNNLLDARAIPEHPNSQRRTGPGGWPTISRAAFISFLRARVIGGSL